MIGTLVSGHGIYLCEGEDVVLETGDDEMLFYDERMNQYFTVTKEEILREGLIF